MDKKYLGVIVFAVVAVLFAMNVASAITAEYKPFSGVDYTTGSEHVLESGGSAGNELEALELSDNNIYTTRGAWDSTIDDVEILSISYNLGIIPQVTVNSAAIKFEWRAGNGLLLQGGE